MELFGLLRKKFLMSDHETWFTGILWVLPGVCEKWPLWAKFSGPFWPQIMPKLGFLELFGLLLKKFLMSDHETWFTGMLWVLPGVCEKWPLWAKFSGPFWPQIMPKLGRKPVFHLFCKRFPLDSNETCILSSLELLLEVCRILAPRSYILGSFLTLNRVRIRPKSQFFVYFAKGAIGFTWN